MKVIFQSSDQFEINRIVKSLDMACFIFELKNNAWREYENSDIDYTTIWDKINSLLDEYGINTNDLVE